MVTWSACNYRAKVNTELSIVTGSESVVIDFLFGNKYNYRLK